MTSIRTSFCKNLHAKCYLNENEALLTSMNLYEFSQINNNEMGILVSREEEPGLYNDILQESMRIVRVSEEIRVTLQESKIPKTVRSDLRRRRAERPRRRLIRKASVYDARPPCRRIRLSRTATAATRVGGGTRTKSMRKALPHMWNRVRVNSP